MTALTIAHRTPSRTAHRAQDTDTQDSRSRYLRILEIVAVIAITIALIAAMVLGSRPHNSQPRDTMRVFVERGDTPWSLAERHPIPGQSTEQTAHEIAELNGVGSIGMPEGTAVLLPAVATTSSMVASR